MIGPWEGANFGFPFFGMGMMFFWFLIFIIIGYIVFQDANKRGMNGVLWWILIVIPMIGIFGLFLYLILRETGEHKIVSGDNSAIGILKERYVKGEITTEEFQVMKGELEK
ncbi:MAG: SHOCT domain-containing protein [Methanobacteriota archaeon]